MKLQLRDGTEYLIAQIEYDNQHITFRMDGLKKFSNIYQAFTKDNLSDVGFYDDSGSLITSGEYTYHSARFIPNMETKTISAQVIWNVRTESREEQLERELTETQMALVEMYETLLTMRAKLEE